MAEVFVHRFTVPPDAIDANGHANNVEYLRWMQDAATGHSDAVGWDLARYRAEGATWVVRSHQIEYLRPAMPGDTLDLLTWVGGFEGAGSPRHHLFLRGRDGKVLARATTRWVFVDAATGRARGVPEALRAAFPVVASEADALDRYRTQRTP